MIGMFIRFVIVIFEIIFVMVVVIFLGWIIFDRIMVLMLKKVLCGKLEISLLMVSIRYDEEKVNMVLFIMYSVIRNSSICLSEKWLEKSVIIGVFSMMLKV